MDNRRKNYPPRYMMPDMPVDVAMVSALNSLEDNLLGHASKHGSSMYLVTAAAGVVAQAVTVSAPGLNFGATLTFSGCAMGRHLDICMLVSASAASRFKYWVGLFPPDRDYIGTTAELAAQQNWVELTAQAAVDNTLPQWIVVRIPRRFEVGELWTIVLGCKNYSGISATYNLYCAHSEWSDL